MLNFDGSIKNKAEVVTGRKSRETGSGVGDEEKREEEEEEEEWGEETVLALDESGRNRDI